MEQAIKRAIEGGYKWHGYQRGLREHDLLDPLFWQALGKAEGWEGKVEIKETWKKVPEFHIEREVKVGEVDTWTYHWHRFIDHLAEGKDVESFFTNLLNN